MGKVIKRIDGKAPFFLRAEKKQNDMDDYFEKNGIFMKMFGVLLLLCLIYIPIISSLGENGLQYPGFLH